MAAWLGGEPISERMRVYKGRTRGFDYLRVLLSISVIGFHTVAICYGSAFGNEVWAGPWRPIPLLILPAFFALSGFLVAGSLVRTRSLPEFLTLRAVRLVPALFFEVLLSALVLGPLLTNLPLAEYFGAPAFREYWLNIVGDIHFVLPGVFADNPIPDMVNQQLWTIPIELRCYIAITVAALLGITRARWRMLAILAASAIALPLIDWSNGIAAAQHTASPVKIMYLSFLGGIALYLYGDRVPLNRWLFLASLLGSWFLVPIQYLEYLSFAPIAYATVYIGLANPPRTVFSRLGDYSYGLYIYGFAVQQTYAALFPSYRVWWMNFIASMVVTLVLAMVSWHFVEAPALRHRSRAVALVDAVFMFLRRLWQFRLRRA